jgi:hypothetical protein
MRQNGKPITFEALGSHQPVKIKADMDGRVIGAERKTYAKRRETGKE